MQSSFENTNWQHFTRLINRSHSVEDLLWCVADIVGAMGFDDCVVYTLDTERNILVQAAAYGDKSVSRREIRDPIELPVGHGITGFVAMTRIAMIVPDVSLEPRYVSDLEALHSEITVPILLGGQVFGVIDSESPHLDHYTESDLRRLERLTELVALRLSALGFSTENKLLGPAKLKDPRLIEVYETFTNVDQVNIRAQALETIGRLSGGIAHDFNNQLAVMRSELDHLSLQFPEMADGTEVLQNSIDRCAALTHSLLAYSSQQTLYPNALVVQNMMGDMQKLFQHSLGNDIEVRTKIDCDLQDIKIDQQQLENALINLAFNSRDAMPDGGVITIGCYTIDIFPGLLPNSPDIEPGRYLVVAVSDTGHGIDEDQVKHVFEPYFTTKENGEGTGLGLSIVYGFVKQSGGEVMLTSVKGAGTSVKLFFPIEEQVKSKPRPMLTAVSLPDGDAKHVLIIEDDVNMAAALEKTAKILGLDPYVAHSSEQALAIVKKKKQLDLVISDIRLGPGEDGPQTVLRILEKFPELKSIFISGFVECFDFLSDPRFENSPFLHKPFSLVELSNAVGQCLSEPPLASERVS